MDIQVVEEYGLSRAHQILPPTTDHHHLHHHHHHQEDYQHDQLYDEGQLVDLRKGPWTVEEDTLLYNYVSVHGEGRWNSLARHAGLKRNGKSCRLRWLNYLRPSVRRGNITLQEQLLILELHSRWGNRWSKIAQYLPGRTDNEIKNYWRTRVQKQAKQLKCDVNSKQFQDAMRHVWIPRLIERIHSARPGPKPEPASATPPPPQLNDAEAGNWVGANPSATPPDSNSSDMSDGPPMSSVSELTDCGNPMGWGRAEVNGSVQSVSGLDAYNGQGFGWSSGGDSLENWWSEEDLSFLQQHLLD